MALKIKSTWDKKLGRDVDIFKIFASFQELTDEKVNICMYE